MTTDIRYSITAEDRFARTFANLRRDLASMKDSALQVGSAVGNMLGGLGVGGAVSVAGMGLAVRQLANDLDALNDSSDATGSTVENLSGLEDVARRNGETLDLVTTSILKMNQALASAKADSPVALALKAIGLNAAELRDQDPSDALLTIAKALSEYENDGNKARLMQELFGKSLREIAPFLNDLVEAGKTNATVTAAQAEEASKFNKSLAALRTNASNTGRAIASELLPAINQLFAEIDAAGTGGSGSLIGQALLVPLQAVSVVGANVAYVFKGIGTEIGGMGAQLAALARGDLQAFSAIGQAMKQDAKAARDELDKLERRLLGITARENDALRRIEDRGFAPPKPKLPDQTGAGTKAAQSEAEKYLETLQKQAENVQELTAYEKVLNDLRANRIEGVGLKVSREQLLVAAQQVDAAQRVKAEAAQELDLRKEILRVEQMSADLMKAVGDSAQRDINTALNLMSATPSGKRERIEADTQKVLDFAAMFPDDSRVQRQASQALQQLRQDLDDLEPKTEEVADGFTRLADTIDKSMDRATASILDFAIEGKGDFADIGKAIARDIARGLIEEPIQKEIKALGKSIGDTLRDSLNGKDIFGEVLKFLTSMSTSAGEGLNSFISWAGGLFAAGSTGRALGGPVKAGQLVRWQEGGREYFVPDQNGTVVPGNQLGAAGQGPAITQVFHVNGDTSPQTVALMKAMIDSSNAKLMRSMRTGGQLAG